MYLSSGLCILCDVAILLAAWSGEAPRWVGLIVAYYYLSKYMGGIIRGIEYRDRDMKLMRIWEETKNNGKDDKGEKQ